MDEGVGVEELLEIHSLVPVCVLQGLPFVSSIGAKAWGVPVHFLRQARSAFECDEMRVSRVSQKSSLRAKSFSEFSTWLGA